MERLPPLEVGQKWQLRNGYIVVVAKKITCRSGDVLEGLQPPTYYVLCKPERGFGPPPAVWGDGSFSGHRFTSDIHNSTDSWSFVRQIFDSIEPEQLCLFGET